MASVKNISLKRMAMFSEGNLFCVLQSKRKEKYFAAKRPDPVRCTCKLVNTLNNTYSKIQKRTKEGFRNTKKQHPHLHYFHSAFVKFRIVATFAGAAVGFDVREL